ncbi:MAG: sodium/proline symporter [FCB group bacterium]|nr:sodium/proline symporter [FCB group bacterium]
MNPILIGLILYLAFLVIVAFWTFRFNKTLGDFLLAGRRLGTWVVAFSERASGESAWLLLGLPGVLFAAGFVELWVAIGCTSGILFSWMFIARPLRVATGKLGALTLPDFFERRFDDDTHALRIFSSLIITFFFTFYVCAQLMAAGKLFALFLPITNLQAMIIGGGIIVFYTLMGGFFAVAWTDFVQAILMLITLVVLPVVAVMELGGWNSALAQVSALHPNHLDILGGKTGMVAALSIISGLAWGLGYMGMPHLLTRFMAIKNPNDLRKGAVIGISWAVLAFWGAMFIGLFATVLLAADAVLDQEKVMPLLAIKLFPGWIAGILIAGALAAMMSTADSQLLVSTSALAEDIYHQLLNKKADQKKLVFISRMLTLLVGVIAFVVALVSKELVYKMVAFAWSGLGASFGPVLLLTLWWKRTTREGVLAGMICGTLVTIVWRLTPALKATLFEIVPAFFMALLACVIVSLLTASHTRGGKVD